MSFIRSNPRSGRVRRFLWCSVLVICAVLPAQSFALEVLRTSDNRIIGFDQMISELREARIVFIGELHTVREHHQIQQEIIRALNESAGSVAVGLEMFREENQPYLDAWVNGQINLSEFLPIYYDNWSAPWTLYNDIFIYARERQVPLIGLNVSPDISKKVARDGFASLTEEEKANLPPGISCDIDSKYMEFIQEAYAGHPGGSDREFLNFCEAQMVWDKAMAWNVMEYLANNPDRTMVVLAGSGHAWKRGIPSHVPDRDFRSAVVLPSIPGDIDAKNASAGDADYVLIE